MSDHQVTRLGQFIHQELPNEYMQDEGAVDTAIRVLRQCLKAQAVGPGSAMFVAAMRENADLKLRLSTIGRHIDHPTMRPADLRRAIQDTLSQPIPSASESPDIETCSGILGGCAKQRPPGGSKAVCRDCWGEMERALAQADDGIVHLADFVDGQWKPERSPKKDEAKK